MADVIVPSNPKDLERVKNAVKEASNCYVRIEAERDELKSIAEVMEEELNIPKKFFNKMVKVYHKSKYDEEVKVQEDFQTLYESVMK